MKFALLLPLCMVLSVPARHAAVAPAAPASVIDPQLKAAMKAAPPASAWPDSSAAHLLDLLDVTIKPDGVTVSRVRESYKLFNERGRAHAEVAIPFNSSYQSARVIQARTIKKSGTVLPVRPADIRSASQFGDYLMYDDAMTISFSMPGVEDDCVIDYTYEITSRPLVMDGAYYSNWAFSSPEPVGLSMCTVHVPHGRVLRSQTHNTQLKARITTSPDGKTDTYAWTMTNVAPFSTEPLMPSPADVQAYIQLSTIKDWSDIGSWFWRLARPQIAPDEAIKAETARLVAGKTTPDQRARAIYDWVARRTRYVGLEFGLSAFRPHPASQAFHNLYGDCKDKATLLISMLGLAGIKAHHALLHTEESHTVSDTLPSIEAFNHCITLADIDGRQVWLDPTSNTCPYGGLPDSDRGSEALVVREGGSEFRKIPEARPEENRIEVDSSVRLQNTGSAGITMEIQLYGGPGEELRGLLRSLSPDKRRQMMQRTAQRFAPGASLESFDLSDVDKNVDPFVMKLQVMAPRFAHRSGSLLMAPLNVSANAGPETNPLTGEHRQWPVRFRQASQFKTHMRLALPQGATILDLPESKSLSGPFQSFHRVVGRSADAGAIDVSQIYEDRIGTVPAAESGSVREYYDSLLKLEDDQAAIKLAGAP